MKIVNPFKEKAVKIEKTYESWNKLVVKPYDPKKVDPFTKVRIILLNGTEFEANWFSHQFFRHCNNNDLRRELSVIRRREQQQQKKIAALKPIEESILQHTLSYEQLAIELTAILAQTVSDKYVKKALDFALLEDFDHLYRFANLIEVDEGIKAESLLGNYTEVTVGRPTISEHRFPSDDVKRFINNQTAELFTKITTNVITAAEQQTMNFYMNQANFYKNELGRKLFTEIAMIEEQHVSLYGGLKDPTCTWLEENLMHEYTECYLYYSLWKDETDPLVKKVWEQHFNDELGHLHKAVELLQKYENKVWEQVIQKGEFPELLKFRSNIDYVREVLKNTVNLTGSGEDYKPVGEIATDSKFFEYQSQVNVKDSDVASHSVIKKYIADNNRDYRFETAEHPIVELRDRKRDNTTVGR